MAISPRDYLTVLERLEIPPEKGIRVFDGSILSGRHVMAHTPEDYALYGFTYSEIDQIHLKTLASTLYPPDYCVEAIGIDHSGLKTREIQLKQLALSESDGPKIFLFFRPLLSDSSLTAFRELIAHLRSPQGCPWDRKQTHSTLRTNLLEEAYEVLDAIDSQNMDSLKEELGDLLLQIVLHAQIAEESGQFNIYDVIAAIHRKIKFRHPHVFADVDVEDVDGVIRNWEILKLQERIKKDQGADNSILASVPNELPALSKAQKYQERAARVGFDWPDIQPVFEKFEEELREFRASHDDRSRELELGDLLFALVNLIRWHGFDAESVLRQANARFLRRFNFIEDTVRMRGKKLTDLTLAEMDEIWEMAKQGEAGSAQSER